MADEKRIKVLIVTNSLGCGGAEIQLARLANCFDKEPFDIQAAYYDKVGIAHPAGLLADSGVKVTYLNRPKWGRIPYLFKAAAFIKHERFDIVHAWHGSANYYATIPAMMAHVPVIVGGLRGKHGSAFAWTLRAIINLGCDYWITNAERTKEIALQKMKFLKPEHIAVVPNGIEIDDESIFKQDTKTFYDSVLSNKPVVGIVGRLTRLKNHLLFIEMAKGLVESGCNADFWIIGDGEMRAETVQAIEKYGLTKHVKLLGYRKDVDAALSRMDVFVLTSDSESCPNVLLEAMRASLPVVSTNCTNLDDIIEDGVNGYIVDVGNAETLVQKVSVLLSSAERKKMMGLCSRRIVEKRFGMPVAVKRLGNAYLDCLRLVRGRNKKLRIKLETF